MRIQVVAPKDVVDEFVAIREAGGEHVEPARTGIDRTEFAFGLGEIAAVVTLVGFAMQLAQQIYAIAQSDKRQNKEVMRLKSAYGIVTISLRPDISIDEIQMLLSKLEAPEK